MDNLLDALIALVIMGTLITTAMTVDSNTRSHVIVSTQELATQQNARTITDVIEYDFRKIGHGLSNPFGAITLADTSHIIFSYDRDPGSGYDSVRVEYVTIPARRTPNPYDKILLRRLNGENNSGAAIGVTRFALRYYNQYGVQLSTPVVSDSLPKIREIELRMVVKSREGFKGHYARTKYVTKFTPKNLLVKYGSVSIGSEQN